MNTTENAAGKVIDSPVELFVFEPANERRLDDTEDRKVAQSIVQHGQVDDVIAYELAVTDKGVKRLQLVEGHRRVHGSILNGAPKTLRTRVLPAEPTAAQRAIFRAISDRHKKKLLPYERMLSICNVVKLNKWSPTETARQLEEEQSVISKNLLTDERATPAVKDRFREGHLSLDDAYLISQLPPDQQNTIASIPVMPKRDQIKGMLKRKGKPDVRAGFVSLRMPVDMIVTVKGSIADLPALIDVLQETVKQLRRAMAKGHDLRSVMRYFSRFLGGDENKKHAEK
jgi:ParB-like chromosome segregation protein Spo0J